MISFVLWFIGGMIVAVVVEIVFTLLDSICGG